ncbi:hypothetical protein BUALT_Bualt15G0035800 [Buddleja alternifolia]|uniref:TF-B3 domain-containing protein n=1 Tax=Buddleja alternifolia TaxID=168488 RepID=A0AAV6WKG0_9LAMI|nr:hypothetical protein BUALT_Bualt15G0035800 [Buddleja alternifolia]
MEDNCKDRLIPYLPQHNHPNLSNLKRKRRKTFKMMEELMEIEETHRPKRVAHGLPNKTRSYKRRKIAITNDLHPQDEILSSVMERAEEVKANLNTKFPSFVKPMIHSNVRGGFWLSLPRLFCEMHLPCRDKTITLVDERHNKYYTNYLPCRRGLSGGWKGFSVAHNLEEGDVLVFQLIGVCKMKVYIVRANRFGAVDAALSLLHLQAQAKVVNHEHSKESGNFPRVQESISRPLSQEILRANFGKCVQSFKSKITTNDTRNISNDIALALEGLNLETMSVAKAIKLCDLTASPHDFTFWNKRLTTFGCFQIIVNQMRARLDQLFCLVLDSRNTSVHGSCGIKEQVFGDRRSVFIVKMQD